VWYLCSTGDATYSALDIFLLLHLTYKVDLFLLGREVAAACPLLERGNSQWWELYKLSQ